MYSTPDEIEAAVKAYRSHISEHNRRVVEVYVSLVADAEPEEGDFGDDEDVNDLRIQSLRPIFDSRLGTFVTTPGEVLTRWDELCTVYDIDGTGGCPSEEQKASCEEYFSLVERALKRTCLEEVRETITFPEEFRILAQQVNTLCGPGLPKIRERYQAYFWLGPHLPEYAEKMVNTPEQLNQTVDGDWECAAGWDTGSGYECYFYIVYCRRRTYQPDQAGGSPEPWAWRYMSVDPMDLAVFDTIPELLKWYSGYRERRVPDASSMTGREVLYGDVSW